MSHPTSNTTIERASRLYLVCPTSENCRALDELIAQADKSWDDFGGEAA